METVTVLLLCFVLGASAYNNQNSDILDESKNLRNNSNLSFTPETYQKCLVTHGLQNLTDIERTINLKVTKLVISEAIDVAGWSNDMYCGLQCYLLGWGLKGSEYDENQVVLNKHKILNGFTSELSPYDVHKMVEECHSQPATKEDVPCPYSKCLKQHRLLQAQGARREQGAPIVLPFGF